ncbi:hypothetical protein DIE16_09345 [Burkholderia sp. Bp9090]|nr:hypothetical protein DIE16_09345 [Burkholderia sp. Bp9090]
MKHPQLSRRANSPTMFRTIGAARASGLSRALRARAPRRATGPVMPAANSRERPGIAPRQIDNQETR